MATRINLGRIDLENHMLRETYGDLRRFGFASPPTEETKLAAAKIVLAFAGADGRVSPIEREGVIAFAALFGAKPATLEALRTFDPASMPIAKLIEGFPPGGLRQLLYNGIRVASLDGFHEREREAAMKLARAAGIEPGVVPAIQAFLVMENAVRGNRHAILGSPPDLTKHGSGPRIREGALARELEYGNVSGGEMPRDFAVKMGKAVLVVAAGDGEVTEPEMAWFLGHAKAMGAPSDVLEEFVKFDARNAALEDHFDDLLRPYARGILFDAVRTARVDGFAAREHSLAVRGALRLGLDETFVEAIEAQLRAEDAVREARAQLLTSY